jgi:hypothetical protein
MLVRPGERGWLKVKNKAYWNYALEREALWDRPRNDNSRSVERNSRGARRLDL